MPNTRLADVTLAVLAGGAGSRMGRAKGLLEVHGRPVLTFLLDRLAWPGPTLLVTAPGREHPPGWQGFDREVADPVAGEGPLRGVMTALAHATTETLVVVAVDMPGVARADLEWFVREMAGGAAPLLMGSRAGRVEPLPVVMRRRAGELVASHLASGRRSLHGLAADPRAAVVPADALPRRAWRNANTPDDWEQFLRDTPG